MIVRRLNWALLKETEKSCEVAISEPHKSSKKRRERKPLVVGDMNLIGINRLIHCKQLIRTHATIKYSSNQEAGSESIGVVRLIKGTFFWACSGIGIVGISQTIVCSWATLIPEWL